MQLVSERQGGVVLAVVGSTKVYCCFERNMGIFTICRDAVTKVPGYLHHSFTGITLLEIWHILFISFANGFYIVYHHVHIVQVCMYVATTTGTYFYKDPSF